MCRERDSNPHGHFWPRDFKSLVSTNSTIAAAVANRPVVTIALQRYHNLSNKTSVFTHFNTHYLCHNGFFAYFCKEYG